MGLRRRKVKECKNIQECRKKKKKKKDVNMCVGRQRETPCGKNVLNADDRIVYNV